MPNPASDRRFGRVILLPIAVRELRVAARKRGTFWLRIIAALIGVIVAAGCLILAEVSSGMGMSPGHGLLSVLTWLAIPVALSAGLFLTSDCISQEKREGTIGFLFLTDLRGYDVVAGKLLATSLRGLFGLLAMLPVLAVTLILGGVTGAQFFKASLALMNAMFCSLVAGLLVSAISRDSQKAMGGTLLLLFALIAGGPLADSLRRASGVGLEPLFGLTSPWFVFTAAGAWGRSWFWSALFTNQVLAWAGLGLACFLVPRTWQEKAKAEVAQRRALLRRFGSESRRANLRRRLLDRNPIAWLACRERWQSLIVWVMGVVMAVGLSIPLAVGSQSPAWVATNFISGLFSLVVYLWITSQACGFFVEARNNGLLELLMATPLSERLIVTGLWTGLVRMFGPPLMLLIASQLVGTFVAQRALATAMASLPAGVAAGTNAPSMSVSQGSNSAAGNVIVVQTSNSASGKVRVAQTSNLVSVSFSVPLTPAQGAGGFSSLLPVLASTAISGLATVANLAAFIWFGMWMGLTSRTAGVATLRTVAFVGLIPWFAIAFVSSMVALFLMMPGFFLKKGSGPSPGWLAWYPVVSAALSALLTLGKDFIFILWARRRLYSSLRARVLPGLISPGTKPPPIPVLPAGPAAPG